jgi:hypothetical protein
VCSHRRVPPGILWSCSTGRARVRACVGLRPEVSTVSSGTSPGVRDAAVTRGCGALRTCVAKRLPDGGYNGDLVTPALGIYAVYEFQYETDTGISTMGGESADPGTLAPEHHAMIEEMLEGRPRERRSVWHECSHADDGAATVPRRPPRPPCKKCMRSPSLRGRMCSECFDCLSAIAAANGDPADAVVREVSVRQNVGVAEARTMRVEALIVRRRSFTLRYSLPGEPCDEQLHGAWDAYDDLGNEYRGLGDAGSFVEGGLAAEGGWAAGTWTGDIRFVGALHEDATSLSLWPLAVGDSVIPILVAVV